MKHVIKSVSRLLFLVLATGLMLSISTNCTKDEKKEVVEPVDIDGKIDDWVVNTLSNSVEITKYKGGRGDLQIPTTIDGVRVTKVSLTNSDVVSVDFKYAHYVNGVSFRMSESLKSVILPDSIEIIQANAFDGCTALEKVSILEPKFLSEIGYGAFSGCIALTYFNLDGASGLKVINEDAFYGCKSLESLDLSNSIKLQQIGAKAFYGCTSLSTIDLSNSIELEFIGEGVFKNCKMLEKIALTKSKNLTIINDNSFVNCTSLYSIKFSSSIEEIGMRAFSGCSNLSSVVFSSKLTSIGYAAFEDCIKLNEVTLKSDNVIIEGYLGNAPSAFGGTPLKSGTNDATVNYPNGANYPTANVWRDLNVDWID